MKRTPKDKIVAISLFSGAGGLDVASFMAGVPVVSSTDFDGDCIETLRLNTAYKNTQIPEIKRIQTFDDKYEFCGDFFDKRRQIGNAVPVLLTKQLAESIRDQYFSQED